MNKISIKCPAKINLSLDVIGKREDGYHDLIMIMQSVSLYDQVLVEKTDSGITIECDKSGIPLNEDNICYKVAHIMKTKFNIDGGIKISINKNIPIAAGLAGGSTDAAGVIQAMNILYELKLNDQEMGKIGLLVGADVPFCIKRGTALAEGIGEVLKELKPVKAWCVLAKPDIAVSTRSVFKAFRLDEVTRHPNTNGLLEFIEGEDLLSLSENMVNVLETVTIKEYPIIFEIKNIMMEMGSLGSLMSGSGPTVFGLFEHHRDAEKCYHRLSDYLKEVFLVSTDIIEDKF